MKKERQSRSVLGKCSAEIHAPDCNGLATSRDHITGKRLGKMLGWSRKKINSRENIQLLSEPCHGLKDNDTCINVNILKKAQNGGITFEEFLELKKPYEVVVYERKSRRKNN